MPPEGAIVIMVGLALVVIAWATGQFSARVGTATSIEEDALNMSKRLLAKHSESYSAQSPLSVWVVCSEAQARRIKKLALSIDRGGKTPIYLSRTADGKAEAWLISKRGQFELIKKNSISSSVEGHLPDKIICLMEEEQLEQFSDLIRPEIDIYVPSDS